MTDDQPTFIFSRFQIVSGSEHSKDGSKPVDLLSIHLFMTRINDNIPADTWHINPEGNLVIEGKELKLHHGYLVTFTPAFE